MRVLIQGAGPAGCAAALAALAEGADVDLIEKSALPRHKVCGEFLSPEIAGILERLGVWQTFLACRPAPMRRIVLHFGAKERRASLPEPAWGLSRYVLDDLMFQAAIAHGAKSHREIAHPGTRPLIDAAGRKGSEPRRPSRLFGFKAHFSGPADDAVELFFFGRCYVGVSPVENGITNVCGLAPEGLLRDCDFDMERIVRLSPALAERLAPLTRNWKWLAAGPLSFRNRFHTLREPGVYPAGDALSFVDPFTGTGILSALLTGRLAGAAAARGTSVAEYSDACRNLLHRPFLVSSLFRCALASASARLLAPLVPAGMLFRLTRPLTHPSR